MDRKMVFFEKQRTENQTLLNHLTKVPSNYINGLLNLDLLEREVNDLSLLFKKSSSLLLKKREMFLLQDNHFLFDIQNISTNPDFLDKKYIQKKQVEVNDFDLFKILTFLEDRDNISSVWKIQRPFILVTKFELNRKQLGSHDSNCFLNLEFLTRELITNDEK
ncbi:MAG: hypothetical protein ACOVOR_00880 [Rhabdochlamydiaceae bacterium]